MDWFLRIIKGMFIGVGFILPGVSGGALAAIFGIYERMISFLAHISKDFKENVLYFIPVGLGGIIGMFLLSFPVSYLLTYHESYILWFFVGCIAGTVPALWQQAGKHGRKPNHLLIMAISFTASLIFLIYGETLFSSTITLNFGTWVLSGAIIGLGVILPGLSSSNLLVYMGSYRPMTEAIKALDFAVLIPLALGVLLCVLLFSKLMDYVFAKAYTGFFHLILGIVISSTLLIIPRDFNYLTIGTLLCLVLCAAGVALGYWMCMLEKKYKPQ